MFNSLEQPHLRLSPTFGLGFLTVLTTCFFVLHNISSSFPDNLIGHFLQSEKMKAVEEIPAYIIHSPTCSERHDIVADLQQKTKATIVDAILHPDGRIGCGLSHLLVAELAKQNHPDSHYLVFEDDCVLKKTWKSCLKGSESVDVLYLGYNDTCEHTVFGTHALYLSPRARDMILYYTQDELKNGLPYDWIVSKLCREHHLQVHLPLPRDMYCFQKPGLRSMITGNIRH